MDANAVWKKEESKGRAIKEEEEEKRLELRGGALRSSFCIQIWRTSSQIPPISKEKKRAWLDAYRFITYYKKQKNRCALMHTYVNLLSQHYANSIGKIKLAIEIIAKTPTGESWGNFLKDIYQDVNCKIIFPLEFWQSHQGHRKILYILDTPLLKQGTLLPMGDLLKK